MSLEKIKFPSNWDLDISDIVYCSNGISMKYFAVGRFDGYVIIAGFLRFKVGGRTFSELSFENPFVNSDADIFKHNIENNSLETI